MFPETSVLNKSESGQNIIMKRYSVRQVLKKIIALVAYIELTLFQLFPASF